MIDSYVYTQRIDMKNYGTMEGALPEFGVMR